MLASVVLSQILLAHSVKAQILLPECKTIANSNYDYLKVEIINIMSEIDLNLKLPVPGIGV